MNRNEVKQAYPALGATDWLCLAAAPTFAHHGAAYRRDQRPGRTCSARPRGIRSRLAGWSQCTC